MEINKIKRSLLVLFFSFLAIGAQAQLEQAVKKIFAGDTITGGHVPLKRDSDSIHLVNMQKSLEEARLNEANMRMEIPRKTFFQTRRRPGERREVCRSCCLGLYEYGPEKDGCLDRDPARYGLDYL